MSLSIRQPTTLHDLAAVGRIVTGLDWATLRSMRDQSESWTVDLGGEPVAFGMLYPLPKGGFEACASFSARARPHMRGILRLTRLTLSGREQDGIVAVIASRAGQRMARICGFSHVTDAPLGEVWAYGCQWRRTAQDDAAPGAGRNAAPGNRDQRGGGEPVPAARPG